MCMNVCWRCVCVPRKVIPAHITCPSEGFTGRGGSSATQRALGPFGVTGDRGPWLSSGGPYRGGASRGDHVRSPDSLQLSKPQGSFLFSQFF